MKIKSWSIKRRLLTRRPFFRVTSVNGGQGARYAIKCKHIDLCAWTLSIYWTDKHYIEHDNRNPSAEYLAEVARRNVGRSI